MLDSAEYHKMLSEYLVKDLSVTQVLPKKNIILENCSHCSTMGLLKAVSMFFDNVSTPLDCHIVKGDTFYVIIG